MASFWDKTKKAATNVIDSPVGTVLAPGASIASKAAGGMGKGAQDNANAQEGLSQAQHAYDNIGDAPQLQSIAGALIGNPGNVTSQAALDPEAQRVQRAQMNALAKLAANGGRDAASDAALANIQTRTGAQARGLREAATADAARRGMSNGNTALLAKLQGNQAATDNASTQGTQLAGQMANTALQAGQGAAGIGASLQGQSNDINSAQDVMARFNAGQQLDVNKANAANTIATQQFNSRLPLDTYMANLAKAGGIASGGKTASDYYGNKYAADERADAAKLGAAVGLGTAAMGKAAAHGGEVEGPEVVSGDSLLNDIVPARGPGGQPYKLSAGEVIVPKELREKSNSEIASFVKNPPNSSNSKGKGDKEKMARMKALSKMANR